MSTVHNAAREYSSTSNSPVDEEPFGHLSGPSETTSHARITRRGTIVSEYAHSESATLYHPSTPSDEGPGYGTFPSSAYTTTKSQSKQRRSSRPTQRVTVAKTFASNPPSSGDISQPNSRPISAYDEPVVSGERLLDDASSDMRTNGIRVWYSSFSSIDWLHDAIKDSARRYRLRRRRSLSGQFLHQLDQATGWIIVSIVGFFTAVVAAVIARGEQYLFNLKEGYCSSAWYKAKNFCCVSGPHSDIPPTFLTTLAEDRCPDWKTWADLFMPMINHGEWPRIESEVVEYVSYAFLAIILAVSSCLLTLKLSASTSFVSSKESGALSPRLANTGEVGMTEPKRKVMYYAAGSGISPIKSILSGFVIHGFLGGRVLFTKSVGLILSVSSGLSLGKEGPFVHIASCIGNIVSRLWDKYNNNEAKRREILSAACAVGVAVAFGAPIGGVLFSLEEVSYFFPVKVIGRSFFCCMVAAMTLKLLDPYGNGKLVLFQVTYNRDWHAYELVFFLFLGVFGGIWGAWFSKLNGRWTRRVREGKWLRTRPMTEVFLVTLVTSVLCFVNPLTRMGGTELIYNLFAECDPDDNPLGLCVNDPPKQAMSVLRDVTVALFVKMGLTIVTFGIKVPAGLYIPSLGVGACAGRIMGILVQWMQHSYPDHVLFGSCTDKANCVIPGLYAMVGAAASLSGVTRSTVSIAVIMFELTNSMTYALPIMLAVLVAKTFADALEPQGINDLVMHLADLPYLDAKQDYAWGHMQISEVVDREVGVICVEESNTARSLNDKLQILKRSGVEDSGLPILRQSTEGRRLVGYIGTGELEHALSRIKHEEMEMRVKFGAATPYHQRIALSFVTPQEMASSINEGRFDRFDFTYYMDQAPLTVQSNSPLELVQQLFSKLGARYVIIVDTEGYYEGIINKKAWIAFLSELKEEP